jgi:hypothetical protein
LRYTSTLSLTLALDGGGWLKPRPARYTPGKETRYLLYRRLSEPQGRSGWVQETSLPPTGIKTPDRPTRNELLYRRRYSGHPNYKKGHQNIRSRVSPVGIVTGLETGLWKNHVLFSNRGFSKAFRWAVRPRLVSCSMATH